MLQTLLYHSYKEFNKVMLQFVFFTLQRAVVNLSCAETRHSWNIWQAWEDEKYIQKL